MTNDQGNPNAPRGSWCRPALCRPSGIPLGLLSPGKSAVAPTSDVGAQSMKIWSILKCGRGSARGALGFRREARKRPRHRISGVLVGTGSKVCRAVGRARAFGKLSTDFQLFPLISSCFRSFDNKNNFSVGGQPCRLCGGLGRIPWIVTPGNA
jgi:hypothetical protein